MYFAAEVEARACLVHPPILLSFFLVVVVSVEDEFCAVCEGACGGVSGAVVGSSVGEGVTTGGVSETGGVGSVAAPLTSLE
jgi:hypothetical protein